MNHTRTRFATTVLAALSIASMLMVPAGADSTPGVTSTEIILGGTHPYSGPASAYAPIGKGALAYFAYINEHGGVNGRKIVYKDADDAYNPPQALQLTRQFVEQDKVFAIFDSLGTPSSATIRPYLNDNKVPQLFVATGATMFGADGAKYPWTIGWQPNYHDEAAIFAKHLLKTTPNAKIAVIYQNDDFGQDYLSSLTTNLGSKSNQIVKSVSYEVTDPDVKSQIASLKNSGADTVFIFATPKFAIQSLATIAALSWKPQIYMTSVSASQSIMRVATKIAGPNATNGVISANYLKDPSNPSDAEDSGLKLYRSILAKYSPGSDSTDVNYLYGMAVAYTMVDALKAAGKNLTRDSLMQAVLHLNEADNPFLEPGITVSTSPNERFPIREEQMIVYQSGLWKPIGNIITARR